MARRLLGLLLGALLALPAAAGPLPQIVLIIDDVGDNLPLGRAAVELPAPLNIAFLPHSPYGAELARKAHNRGKEVMLHAPMSNHTDFPLGPGGLTADMDRAEFLVTLRSNLDSIPHVRGVNNHMGSYLTELPRPMGWLMSELKQRRLFFVDSRTTVRTVAEQQASEHRLPHLRRHVFLDNVRDETAIARQFDELLRKAREQGLAVGIGHPYPETLAFLRRQLGALTLRGYQLVTVSEATAAPPDTCDRRWVTDLHCGSILARITTSLHH